LIVIVFGVLAEVNNCSISEASDAKSSPMIAVENVFVRNLSEYEHHNRWSSQFQHVILSQISSPRDLDPGFGSSIWSYQTGGSSELASKFFSHVGQFGIEVWRRVGYSLSLESSLSVTLSRKGFAGVFYGHYNLVGFPFLWFPDYCGWRDPCPLIKMRCLSSEIDTLNGRENGNQNGDQCQYSQKRVDAKLAFLNSYEFPRIIYILIVFICAWWSAWFAEYSLVSKLYIWPNRRRRLFAFIGYLLMGVFVIHALMLIDLL
jgi:hypothetical protein